MTSTRVSREASIFAASARWLVLVPLALAWGAPALCDELPVELAAVIEQARADQLPVDALALKAREGIAKGVPPAKIHVVLLADLSSLGEARRAAPTLSVDVLPAAARAVRAGASPAAVRALAEVTEQARSYDATADLLNAGLSELDTLRLVRSAAAGRGPDAALPGLATAVSAMLRNGHATDAVVARLEAIVAGGGSPLSVLPDLPSQVPEHANGVPGGGVGKGGKQQGPPFEGPSKGKGGGAN